MMAAALGMTWPDDRAAVLGYLNKYRNLLFNNYQEDNQLSNVFHCICVSQFREACVRGTCSPGNIYHGFTLPRDVAAVESIYESGVPLTLRSRWRETLYGIPVGCGGRVDAMEMAQQFPTERDLDSICALKLFADKAEDAGKKVFVAVIDADWKDQVLEFTLGSDAWAYVGTLVREIKSIALPVGRVGTVTIAQADGRELSLYTPGETVPAYRRFKVPASCNPHAVIVQGIKQYFPVWWDYDIVEIGDALVIEHAAKYFKYGENTTEQKEIKTAEYHLAKMKEQLAGLISRNRGAAIEENNPSRGRPITKSTRLPGYRR